MSKHSIHEQTFNPEGRRVLPEKVTGKKKGGMWKVTEKAARERRKEERRKEERWKVVTEKAARERRKEKKWKGSRDLKTKPRTCSNPPCTC